MFNRERLSIVVFSLVAISSFAQLNKDVAVQPDPNKSTPTIFSGLLPDSVKSIIIHINDVSLHKDWNGNYSDPSSFYIIPVTNGKFQFKINISHPVYLRDGYGRANSPDFIEPGDSIQVNLKQRNFVFYTGRGAEKLNCKEEIVRNKEFLFPTTTKGSTIPQSDSVTRMVIKTIEIFKYRLSSAAYTILKADYIPDLTESINERATGNYSAILKKTIEQHVREYITIINLTDPNLVYSQHFYNTIANTFCLLYSMQHNKEFFVERYRFSIDFYQWFTNYLARISSNYYVKEQIAGHYLLEACYRGNMSPYFLPAVKEYVSNTPKTTYYHQALNNWIGLYETRFKKGAPAYSFVLRDTLNRTVKLTDFKGKVVLLDFMFTGCSGCVQMCQQIKNIEERYEGKGIVFISISTDKELDKVKRGVPVYSPLGSLLLYTNGEGFDSPIIKYYDIQSAPNLVLIDRKGHLVAARAPDPRLDQGKTLTALIETTLSK